MNEKSKKFIVDDRLYADNMVEKILHMSDSEFAEYIKSIKED